MSDEVCLLLCNFYIFTDLLLFVHKKRYVTLLVKYIWIPEMYSQMEHKQKA